MEGLHHSRRTGDGKSNCLAHDPVSIRRLDEIVFLETCKPQGCNVQSAGFAVNNQLRHELPDDGRHFETVAAESHGTITAFNARQLVENRVPIGCDRIEGAEAATSV